MHVKNGKNKSNLKNTYIPRLSLLWYHILNIGWNLSSYGMNAKLLGHKWDVKSRFQARSTKSVLFQYKIMWSLKTNIVGGKEQSILNKVATFLRIFKYYITTLSG